MQREWFVLEGFDPAKDLEAQKLQLERFKARLEFRKFVLGSVFVAIANRQVRAP